jgi:hypothetical protein
MATLMIVCGEKRLCSIIDDNSARLSAREPETPQYQRVPRRNRGRRIEPESDAVTISNYLRCHGELLVLQGEASLLA